MSDRREIQERRIAAIDEEFVDHPDFALTAISMWWNLEQARSEFRKLNQQQMDKSGSEKISA